jgi:lipopolysaccharide export system protein LptC
MKLLGLSTHRLAILGALLAVLALALWLPKASLMPTLPDFNGATRHDPDYIIDNFTATAMDERGQRRYILRARKLVHYPDDLTSALSEPTLTQFADDGTPVLTSAATGQYNTETHVLTMSGSVRIVRAGDETNPAAEMTSRELRVRLN